MGARKLLLALIVGAVVLTGSEVAADDPYYIWVCQADPVLGSTVQFNVSGNGSGAAILYFASTQIARLDVQGYTTPKVRLTAPGEDGDIYFVLIKKNLSNPLKANVLVRNDFAKVTSKFGNCQFTES